VLTKRRSTEVPPTLFAFIIFLFVFAVLGFELRAYILSHSTSPFL
jgi:hypothetical protein